MKLAMGDFDGSVVMTTSDSLHIPQAVAQLLRHWREMQHHNTADTSLNLPLIALLLVRDTVGGADGCCH